MSSQQMERDELRRAIQTTDKHEYNDIQLAYQIRVAADALPAEPRVIYPASPTAPWRNVFGERKPGFKDLRWGWQPYGSFQGHWY